VEPLKLMEPHHMFHGTLGFRGTPVEEHWTTMKTKGRQLQRAFKTRWLSSEATVRAWSEILATWAALKQLSENNSDEMCVVLLRLMKKKISTWCFGFVNIATSPDKNEQRFSGGMF